MKTFRKKFSRNACMHITGRDVQAHLSSEKNLIRTYIKHVLNRTFAIQQFSHQLSLELARPRDWDKRLRVQHTSIEKFLSI
jgi:hypothetical protein